MTFFWGDGFDCYAAPGDAILGYWDSGSSLPSLVAGRFSGSQAFQTASAATPFLAKSSGVNDPLHHFIIAFRQTAALSGTTAGFYLQLVETATNQCCVVFRSDGAILLTSATPTGTTLATYTGAVSAQNTWFGFEIEVFISATAGYMNVRKNGNTSNDFTSATNLNTRPGTNSYANKLQLGNNGAIAAQFDDLLWRSDASSVPWVGDIRCYTRMPASDASVQFTKSSPTASSSITQSTTAAIANGTARYTSLITQSSGMDVTIGSIVVSLAAGYTGNMKCAIFANSAGAPGAVLATATPINNPATGNNTFTFPSPLLVTRSTQYLVGFCSDTSSGTWNLAAGSTGWQSTTVSYAAFPVASPAITGVGAVVCTVNYTAAGNYALVNETLQDGATSYVYDSTVNDADFYTIAALAGTPSSTVGVTTRGFLQKSDAGTRGAAVQLKSGSAFVPSTWNSADMSAGITLSNANLTMTTTSAGALSLRSVGSVTSGKYYWEYTFTNAASTMGMGIANAAAILGNFLTSIGNTVNTCVVNQGGAGYTNGAQNFQTGNVPAIGTGTIICVALDVGAQLIWFRNTITGNWNNSGTANPATGVGGNSIAGFAGPYFAYAGGNGSNPSGAITANFGASAFSGAVPSGFASGFGASGYTVTSTPTLLSTSWGWLFRSDTVDPATGAAWTATGVNNAQIGPKVTS